MISAVPAIKGSHKSVEQLQNLLAKTKSATKVDSPWHVLHGQMSAGRLRHGGRCVLFRISRHRDGFFRNEILAKVITYADRSGLRRQFLSFKRISGDRGTSATGNRRISSTGRRRTHRKFLYGKNAIGSASPFRSTTIFTRASRETVFGNSLQPIFSTSLKTKGSNIYAELFDFEKIQL